jgi:hypothetical protein
MDADGAGGAAAITVVQLNNTLVADFTPGLTLI